MNILRTGRKNLWRAAKLFIRTQNDYQKGYTMLDRPDPGGPAGPVGRVPVAIHSSTNHAAGAGTYPGLSNQYNFGTLAEFQAAFNAELGAMGMKYRCITMSYASTDYLTAEMAAAAVAGLKLYVHLYIGSPTVLGYNRTGASAYTAADTAAAGVLNANKAVIAGLLIAEDQFTDNATDAAYRASAIADLDPDIPVYTSSKTSSSVAYLNSRLCPPSVNVSQGYPYDLGIKNHHEGDELRAIDEILARSHTSDGMYFQAFGWYGAGHPGRWNGSTYITAYHDWPYEGVLYRQLKHVRDYGLRGPYMLYSAWETSTAQRYDHAGTADGADDLWCGLWEHEVLELGGSFADARHQPQWNEVRDFQHDYGLQS